jgi:homogentisate 1,2-dioxygenase
MGAGEPSLKQGVSIYVYSFNRSMSDDKKSFNNSDGDFLVVPHSGTLHIKTLMGKMTVKPK